MESKEFTSQIKPRVDKVRKGESILKTKSKRNPDM